MYVFQLNTREKGNEETITPSQTYTHKSPRPYSHTYVHIQTHKHTSTYICTHKDKPFLLKKSRENLPFKAICFGMGPSNSMIWARWSKEDTSTNVREAIKSHRLVRHSWTEKEKTTLQYLHRKCTPSRHVAQTNSHQLPTQTPTNRQYILTQVRCKYVNTAHQRSAHTHSW